MATYRRVYDLHQLQADCQEPGSAPEPYARLIEYGLPLPLLCSTGSSLSTLSILFVLLVGCNNNNSNNSNSSGLFCMAALDWL